MRIVTARRVPVRLKITASAIATWVTAYRPLLQELLFAYGPCGQEDAVRDVCLRELEPVVDEAWTDPAGNVVGLLRGGDAPAVRVMAHMDELSMLVKRIDEDGTLHLTPLGTMYPGNFGLGPVAVLGQHTAVCGVLALGSEHTTQESPRIWQTKPDQGDKALDWPDVYVFTGLTRTELSHAGVAPGTRVCVDRSKRTLVDVGNDYLGVLLPRRPRRAHRAAVRRPRTAGRHRAVGGRVLRVHHQRGDRRDRRRVRQPHAAR